MWVIALSLTLRALMIKVKKKKSLNWEHYNIEFTSTLASWFLCCKDYIKHEHIDSIPSLKSQRMFLQVWTKNSLFCEQ